MLLTFGWQHCQKRIFGLKLHKWAIKAKNFLVAMLRHHGTGGTGHRCPHLIVEFWRKVTFSKGKISVSHLKHWPKSFGFGNVVDIFGSIQSNLSAVPGNAIGNYANQKSATRPDDLGQCILHRTMYLFWDFFNAAKITLICSLIQLLLQHYWEWILFLSYALFCKYIMARIIWSWQCCPLLVGIFS